MFTVKPPEESVVNLNNGWPKVRTSKSTTYTYSMRRGKEQGMPQVCLEDAGEKSYSIFHFGIIVAEVFSKLEDAPFIASSITLSLSIAHRS